MIACIELSFKIVHFEICMVPVCIGGGGGGGGGGEGVVVTTSPDLKA